MLFSLKVNAAILSFITLIALASIYWRTHVLSMPMQLLDHWANQTNDALTTNPRLSPTGFSKEPSSKQSTSRPKDLSKDFVYLYLSKLPLLEDSPEHKALSNYSDEAAKYYRKDALEYYFATALTRFQRKNLIKTLQVCLEMLEKIGVKYMLYSGTLIGYYRHNQTLIPWDDDADFAVFPETTNFVAKLREVAKSYKNMAVYFVPWQKRLKCFGTDPSSTIDFKHYGYAWRWPFADLQLMQKFSTPSGQMVRDATSHSYEYKISDVFPLKRGYFTEAKIPVFLPNNIENVLKHNVDISQCQSPSYNHRKEDWVSTVVTVNCSELRYFVNFSNNVLL